MGRCMSALAGEFPDQKQRSAVCHRQFRGGDDKKGDDKKEGSGSDDKKKHMMSHELRDVEIFRPGIWNGIKFTDQDMAAIVESHKDLGYEVPVKVGHAENPGGQAWGWVKDLRSEGGRILANLTDLPETLYRAIKEKRYNALSSEIFFDLKRNGRTFRRALKAVALLGAEIPAVDGLKPLSACLSVWDSFETIHFCDEDGDHMDDLTRFKEENQRLAAEINVLKNRKDLTADMVQLQKTMADKEALITDSARKIAELRQELRQSKIADKVAKLSIPAYRGYLRALYELVDFEKVVKLGEEEKTGEQLIDALAAKINADSDTLFKEIGNGGMDVKSDETPDVKLARLSEKYAFEHKMSYKEAQRAVLEADRALAEAYAAS